MKNGVAKIYKKMIRKRISERAPALRARFSRRVNPEERCHGSAERSAVNPSRGGNGIRLKRPSKRFINEIVAASETAVASSPIVAEKRTIRPKIIASMKFVATPASATNVSPHR